MRRGATQCATDWTFPDGVAAIGRGAVLGPEPEAELRGHDRNVLDRKGRGSSAVYFEISRDFFKGSSFVPSFRA
eukprot:6872508-Prymnesium_polylepis.1